MLFYSHCTYLQRKKQHNGQQLLVFLFLHFNSDQLIIIIK